MTQTTEEPIPAGYWRDAKGNLIRDELVKPIDKERDSLVRDIVEKAKQIQGVLADFKAKTFADVACFVELSAEQYGANIGGKKGNVTMFTFDGRYKVQRAIAESITFDERLQAAKGLIDECLQEWTVGARPEIQTLITDAFATDKQGNINVGKILTLRRLEIEDPRWKNAMKAIADATLVVGSKSYIRVYERIGDSDEYLPIALDLAGA